MPTGTNNQGNSYNTPGGTNSNSGGSYQCKFDNFHFTLFFTLYSSTVNNYLSQIRTLTVATITVMITVASTTVLQVVAHPIRPPVEAMGVEGRNNQVYALIM